MQNVCALPSVPVQKVINQMSTVPAAAEKLGEIAQNSAGPLDSVSFGSVSCLWGCRPQNKVSVGTAATHNACIHHGGKIVIDNSDKTFE